MHMSAGYTGARRDHGVPGAGVTGSCGLFKVGAGNCGSKNSDLHRCFGVAT